MEITSVRLYAISPDARPQVIDIKPTPGQTRIIGRQDFNSGDDTVISRRHALFSILSGAEGDKDQVLVVQNLSLINGILVNFRPVTAYSTQALVDGDEIVSTLPPHAKCTGCCFVCTTLMFLRTGLANFTVFLRGTWTDGEDQGNRLTRRRTKVSILNINPTWLSSLHRNNQHNDNSEETRRRTNITCTEKRERRRDV